jgi:hypothetical protein
VVAQRLQASRQIVDDPGSASVAKCARLAARARGPGKKMRGLVLMRHSSGRLQKSDRTIVIAA